jgi:hypothetical protein
VLASVRIVTCDRGIKYARSLSTRNEKAAKATIARVEDNLHRRQHDLIVKTFPAKGLKYPKGDRETTYMTSAEGERRVQRATPAKAADASRSARLS